MKTNDPVMGEQEMLCTLSDIGMLPELIEQFMENFHLGKSEQERRILSAHRAELLLNIHAEQEKLYRLDFLLRKL